MELSVKRVWVSRLLLLAFVPMLLFSSLHVHHQVAGEGECYECANHLHHSGHISLQTASFHDCVLCQFVTLTYVSAVAVVFVVAATLHTVQFFFPSVQCLSVSHRSRVPRAPPVV